MLNRTEGTVQKMDWWMDFLQDFHVSASPICLYSAFFCSFTHPSSLLWKVMKTFSTRLFSHHLFIFSITPEWVCVSSSMWQNIYNINKLLYLPSIRNFPNRATHAERHHHLTVRLQLLIHHDSVTNVTRDYFTKATVHCEAWSCLRWFTCCRVFCLTMRLVDELCLIKDY